MSAERDFHATLDRAAGLLIDARAAACAAARGPVPRSHRQRANCAIATMTKAQDELFLLRRLPFETSNTLDDQMALL